MLLESMQHENNAYLTLSYADEFLPVSASGAPTLVPKDVSDFLKRWRVKIAPTGGRIRFCLVGEYGEKRSRPHYHLIIFNHSTCLRSRTLRRPPSTRPLWAACCPVCAQIGDIWGKGDVDLGTVTDDSCAYVAQYITKKMTRPDDVRLGDRYPEFARRSLKPGIGQAALYEVASQLLRYNLVPPGGDVPSVLMSGRKMMPIGRYMRQQLRMMVGLDAKAPQSTLDQMAAEVRAVWDGVNADAPEASGALKVLMVKDRLVIAGNQQVLNAESRRNLRRRSNEESPF